MILFQSQVINQVRFKICFATLQRQASLPYSSDLCSKVLLKFSDEQNGLEKFKMLVEADLLKGLDSLRTGFNVMSRYFDQGIGERPTFAVTLCKNCQPSEELDRILYDFTIKFATKLIYPELKAILLMLQTNNSSKLDEIMAILMQTPELKVVKLFKTLIKCGRVQSSEHIKIFQI